MSSNQKRTKLIIVTGKAQSGKDSACDFVKILLKEKGFSSKKYAFADPLKEICSDLFGIEKDLLWGENYQKEKLTRFKWSDIPFSNNCESKEGFLTVRDVLQLWGTDIFRTFNPDCWVMATHKKIKQDNFDFALISDCRFQNEINFFAEENPLVIHLSRNVLNLSHESENCNINYDGIKNYSIIDNSEMDLDDKNHFIKRAVEDYIESYGDWSQTKQNRRVFQR